MADERAAALKLLRGLVDDPALRARFRADPTAVADEAGLPRVARELAGRSDVPMALEVRESRSGLAGVLMAAAVEGLALGGILEHAPDAQALAPASADRAHPPRNETATFVASGDRHLDAPRSSQPPDDDSAPGQYPDEPVDADRDPPNQGGEEDEPDEDEPDEDEPDEDEPDGDEPDDVAPSDPDSDSGSDSDSDSEPDHADDDEPDLPDGPRPYPGDEAPKAARAAWMAAAARHRGLPPELPVMASLVESGLENVQGGDRDSVGYFQMRTSIWDQGPYAGYQSRPERQLDWFLDHAEAVGKQRAARGLATDDERQYGEWIADVERPAAQYRGRYQEQLDEAHSLLSAISESADSPRAGPQARQALALAEGQLGRPYRWGGSTPEGGFDCSGLVQWAYKKVGIDLPRVTQDQVNAPGGRHIARKDLLPGDLVFFRDKTGDVHHVGISMGGDKFIHAPHTGGVIHQSSLDEPYYREEFIGGRRFAGAGGSHDVQRLPAVKRLGG